MAERRSFCTKFIYEYESNVLLIVDRLLFPPCTVLRVARATRCDYVEVIPYVLSSVPSPMLHVQQSRVSFHFIFLSHNIAVLYDWHRSQRVC